MERTNYSSGAKWEEIVGYSHTVKIGNIYSNKKIAVRRRDFFSDVRLAINRTIESGGFLFFSLSLF